MSLFDKLRPVAERLSGVAAGPIAEFVMARLLEVWKDTRRIEAQQRQRQWRRRFGSEVAGRTLGVVGFGAIGRATAVLAHAFGMRVVATRRSAPPADRDPDVDDWFGLDRLDELLELGKSERRNAGRAKPSILADIFEAVLGALYLDAGLGAVRALVTLPTFDNNMFSAGASPEAFVKLLTDPDLPLVNRALTGQPPGSTSHPLTPGRTLSGIPPARVATTARRCAMASSVTSELPS